MERNVQKNGLVNLAAALAMSGQRDSAARLLSRDMAPNDVQAALDRFVALTKE